MTLQKIIFFPHPNPSFFDPSLAQKIQGVSLFSLHGHGFSKIALFFLKLLWDCLFQRKNNLPKDLRLLANCFSILGFFLHGFQFIQSKIGIVCASIINFFKTNQDGITHRTLIYCNHQARLIVPKRFFAQHSDFRPFSNDHFFFVIKRDRESSKKTSIYQYRNFRRPLSFF